MRKFNLLNLILIALISLPLIGTAQTKMGNWETNWYKDYVGERVLLVAPSSIAGPVTYRISNDGDTAGNGWGKAIKDVGNTLLNVDIVKADPYEACGVLANATALQNKVALVKRGNCEFGAKAKQAENAGAIAVIIVNNIPGPPVGMGAGAQGASVNIPVIMVSDVDGAAIEAQIANGAKISMTTWGQGFATDIGFVDDGLSLGHAYAIPIQQMDGNTGLPLKNVDGAVAANFGSTTVTNVKIKTTVRWTPTGGSATVVREDSSTAISSFAAADSIVTPFIDDTYTLNPTGTGQYEVTYELISDQTDQFPQDNIQKYTIDITNGLYSKGLYDINNNSPRIGLGYRFGDARAFTWGPMYYIEKANYQIQSAQFVLSGDNTDLSNLGDVYVLAWEWNDANSDSIIACPEMNLVGAGLRKYGAGDTSGQLMTVNMADAGNAAQPLVTKANTWYWMSVTVPAGAFLGVDASSNYFTRSWSRWHSSSQIREPYAPIHTADFQDLQGQPATQALLHFPFESYYFAVDSIRFSRQKDGLVPAVPMRLSLFTVDVDEVENEIAQSNIIELYPNPATDVVNVSVDLNGKTAEKINYVLLNGVGQEITRERHQNVTGKDKFTINTGEMAAGIYYILTDVDDEVTVKRFSIVK